MSNEDFKTESIKDVKELFSENESPEFFLGVLGDTEGAATNLNWVENSDAGLNNVIEAIVLLTDQLDEKAAEDLPSEVDRGDVVNLLRMQLQNLLIRIEVGNDADE